jgi:hypothetical protein
MKRIQTFVVAVILVSIGLGLAWGQSPRASAISIHSVAVDLPASTTAFPPGPGSDLAGKCLSCHSAGMVLKQPALTQTEWKAEINKMRNVYGAPIDESEVDALSVYMSKINADQQTK